MKDTKEPKTPGRPPSEYVQQVLDFLAANGPSTAKQIHEGLGSPWETGKPHTRIRTAIGGLVAKGKIKTEPQRYSLDNSGN